MLQFCCCSRSLLGLLCAVAAGFPGSSWAELPPHRQPVIGVLTYPGSPSLLDQCVGAAPCSALQLAVQKESAYVESSYPRWLQMAGARVVPIPYDSKPEAVRQLFSKLNGVLFTGGPAKPLSAPKPYFATATLLYGLVEEAWKKMDLSPVPGFPLWEKLVYQALRPHFPSIYGIFVFYARQKGAKDTYQVDCVVQFWTENAHTKVVARSDP